MKKTAFNFFKIILGPVFLICYRPKVVNKHYIPKKGSIILCGNHLHYFDQNLVILSTKRYINFMAKKEYFDSWKTKWFFNSVGCIPVDRNNKNKESLIKAKNILRNGGAIGIFPEGTRNKTEKMLLEFKKGAVIMAKDTDSYLVPFAITGKYKFFKNNLKIEFIKPFKVNNLDVEDANNLLYDKIKSVIEKGE